MQDPEYIGLIDVDGVPCHHLSFSAGGTAWQPWVNSGEQPLPKMMAITYTDIEASQRAIELFEQIADKPDAAERIATEKAKQEKLGPVAQKEIDAYVAKKEELVNDLAEARAGVR